MSTPTPGRPGTLGLPTDREDAGALIAVGQVSDHREDEVTTRVASAADAPVIAEILAEAFEGYRAWAPPEWSPPSRDGEEAFVAVLSRSDCLVPAG